MSKDERSESEPWSADLVDTSGQKTPNVSVQVEYLLMLHFKEPIRESVFVA